MREWREVTKPNPCPACGKPDWCAWSSAGYLKCERTDTPPDGFVLVSSNLEGHGALFAPKDRDRQLARPAMDEKPKKTYPSAKDAAQSLANVHGRPTARWGYRDSKGQLVGGVIRWDTPSGKQVRPIARNGAGWFVGSMPSPRPLYRLHELVNRSLDAMTLIVEGEKAAEAAKSIGLFAVTSAGGSNAAGLTDWTPLAGRTVCILPDNDAAGEGYAKRIIEALKECDPKPTVRKLALPGLGNGEDIADFIDRRREDGKDDAAIRAEVERLIDKAEIVLAHAKPIIAVDWNTFAAEAPEQERELIVGILRHKEILNIISGSKARKSFLVHSLALSLASGERWLDRIVDPGPVLLIDNELHKGTLKWRIDRVSRSMGLDSARFNDRLRILSMRGRLSPVDRLFDPVVKMSDDIGGFAAIILDPLYRMYPSRVEGESFNENSNAHVTAFYNALDTLAQRTGSAVVCVHHTSKGSQIEKAVADIGSGAGAFTRATDSHVAMRRHAVEGCQVVEMVLRSLPPVDPFVIAWDSERYLYRVDPTADPTDLWKPGARRESAEGPDPQAAPPAKTWTAEELAKAHLDQHPERFADAVERIRRASGLSRDQTEGMLRQACVDGHAVYDRGAGRNPSTIRLVSALI